MYCACRRSTAADLDVLAPRCFPRTLQRCLDAIGDEVERRAAIHLERRPRVVREREGRRVIGRVVTPPPSPVIVRPLASDRAEHVPSQDEGTEAVHPAPRELVVGAGIAPVFALHLTEGASGKEPLEQLRPPLAERVVQALLRARRKAIERHPEAGDPVLVITSSIESRPKITICGR